MINRFNQQLNHASSRIAASSRIKIALMLAGLLTLFSPLHQLGANEPNKLISKEEMMMMDTLYTPLHWQDTTTGFAIGGFDMVAYFGDNQTRRGSGKFQHYWRGTNWQFINSGNLKAFKRSPEAYVPRYAGYDPYALAKGILVEGHPKIWKISMGQLYLFQNEVNRYLWESNPARFLKKTNQNWRKMSLQLPRYKIDR